jgi:hypothetical protein
MALPVARGLLPAGINRRPSDAVKIFWIDTSNEQDFAAMSNACKLGVVDAGFVSELLALLV